MIRTKAGVRFFDPILDAIQLASESMGIDLTITSGTDGAHSGPDDPHHSGRAYDVRSQNLANDETKLSVLYAIMRAFNDGPTTGGLTTGMTTTHFFGWLENAGTDNEHFHVQIRHGLEAPAPSPAASPSNPQT